MTTQLLDYTMTVNDLAVLAHLRAHLRQTKQDTFSADDFRRWRLHKELDNQDTQHAVGDWFRKAKTQKEIDVCGWVTSMTPSNNRRKIRLYKLVKK